jgi:hypothetical protein
MLRDRLGRFATEETVAAEQFDRYAHAAAFETYAEDPMDRGTCQSCLAAIFWMTTTTGGRMPIDCEPVPDGNIRLLEEFSTVEVLGKKATSAARTKGEKLYKSHFASCPNAAKHRKGRKPR